MNKWIKTLATVAAVGVPALAPVATVLNVIPAGTLDNLTSDPAGSVLGMLESVPWIKQVLAGVMLWAGGFWLTARAVGQAGVAFRWFAKFTKTTADDVLAEEWVFWADVVEDLCDDARKGRWQKLGQRAQEAWQDRSKPINERRHLPSSG